MATYKVASELIHLIKCPNEEKQNLSFSIIDSMYTV